MTTRPADAPAPVAWRRLALGLGWVSLAAIAIVILARLTGWEAGALAILVSLTPWLAFAALVPLALAALGRSWPLAAGALAALALTVVWTVPLFVADGDATRAPEGDAAPALTVASVSATFGGVDADAVVALVRDASVDVLAVQELTPECVEALAAAGLAEELPHAELRPEEGFTGTGLYSRLPLTDAEALSGLTSWTVRAEVATEAGALTVLAPHPAAPGPLYHSAWESDLAALADLVSEVDGPLLVLGDLNATRDHRAFRRLEDAGLSDAVDQAGAGFQPTFPEGRGPFPLVELDHAMIRDAMIVATHVRTVSVPGSDHRALVVDYSTP